MNKELEALVKLLDDPDESISGHVEEKLLSYGSEIVGFLESAWEQSFDPIVQQRIENLVHKLQFTDVLNELKLWYHGGAFDILEGMMIINRYQYPDMDTEKVLIQIEEIKREVWLQMLYEMSPLEKIKLINHVFYTVYGFSGNTSNHQDPNNSYISQVLESKKGNQISLAVIYSIVARKLDIPIYGINLPQHFILGYVEESIDDTLADEVLFYVNAFNKGFIFSRKDIDSFLKQLNLQPEKHYYEPCSNADIIRRVLRNLTSSYQKSGNDDKVQEIGLLLEAVDGQASAS